MKFSPTDSWGFKRPAALAHHRRKSPPFFSGDVGFGEIICQHLAETINELAAETLLQRYGGLSITELSRLTRQSRQHTHEAVLEACQRGYIEQVESGCFDPAAGQASRAATSRKR